MAEERGTSAHHGLAVELRPFANSTNLMRSMLGGASQIVYCSPHNLPARGAQTGGVELVTWLGARNGQLRLAGRFALPEAVAAGMLDGLRPYRAALGAPD